jgi:anti-sigma regulatory factor (Ser/Thr protein kinase)
MRVSLASRVGEIRRINAALSEFLSEEGVPDRTIYQVRLVVEELVSNIVRYGFDDESVHRIDLDVRHEPRRVVVAIEDDGRPFNPGDAPLPRLPDISAAGRAGGLGIYMVKKLTTNLLYARVNDRNRVRAVIEFGPK